MAVLFATTFAVDAPETMGRLGGLGRKAATSRARQLLEDLGMADAWTQKAGTYSGGMRRRLDLAAGIAGPGST